MAYLWWIVSASSLTCKLQVQAWFYCWLMALMTAAVTGEISVSRRHHSELDTVKPPLKSRGSGHSRGDLCPTASSMWQSMAFQPRELEGGSMF